MEKYSFAGKRVLVTGGASGIGRKLVQRLSDDGAVVFTIDKDAGGVEKLRTELPNVKAEIVDLTDWKATRAVVESFGKIDHLVNNAGLIIFQTFMDITEEAANLQYNVMAQAVINVSQVVAKTMIESGGGTIVNVGSMAARKKVPGTACYAAAKSALVSLTKSIALELGAHGIRANCVLPGLTDTPLNKSAVEGPFRDQYMNSLVIKKIITTDEVANMVLYLLSPLSSMTTGEEVSIDGGFALK